MAETVDYVVIGLGAFGSATAYQLASRGLRVLGLEKFALGHVNGASHDSSRIVRRSYHAPNYVRLAGEAYDDWADLARVAGGPLVVPTGGLDLFPTGAAIAMSDYADSLATCGIPYDVLDPAAVAERWPRVALPEGGLALHQADTGMVHAARTVATLQRLAVERGAELRDNTPARVLAADSTGVTVTTPSGEIHAGRVVVTADAWTNEVIAGLGERLPLDVTKEQVSYFTPDRPEDFAPGRFPVWIWMDDPSFYGFPTFGEPSVKAGEDAGGKITTGDDRDFEPDPDNLAQLTAFMRRTFPGSATEVLRTVTCLYTLTRDRDFVMSALPSYPQVVVALGAGHGFKFTPTFGRVLADLATEGRTTSGIAEFSLERPALTDADYPIRWRV
jgi:sarcosine oxidase